MTPGRPVAALSGAVALLVAAASPYGLVLAAVGAAFLLWGLYSHSKRGVAAGAGALFAGILAAGVTGAPPGALVVGGVATLLARDAGEHALDLRTRLGPGAPTSEAERAHVAATAVLAAGAGAGAYLIYRVTAGRLPPTAAVALLAGALLLAAALRA